MIVILKPFLSIITKRIDTIIDDYVLIIYCSDTGLSNTHDHITLR